MNEVRVLGTHNSYRTRPPEPLWGWLQKLAVKGAVDPGDLDYGHGPVPEQLGRGSCRLALELYGDCGGGGAVWEWSELEGGCRGVGPVGGGGRRGGGELERPRESRGVEEGG